MVVLERTMRSIIGMPIMHQCRPQPTVNTKSNTQESLARSANLACSIGSGWRSAQAARRVSSD